MKKTLLFSLLFVAILGMNSCTKEAISEANQDFIGSWSSQYDEIFISFLGTGSFERSKNGTETSFEGNVKITDEYVKFSAGIISKKLTIDVKPFYNLLTFQDEMVLDGETYVKN